MRILMACSFVVLAASPAMVQGHEQDKKKGGKVEIHVYIADEAKKPVDLKDVTGTVVLESKGGIKKTLKLDLVTPKGDKKVGIGHGGTVAETDGYHVEFVVEKLGKEDHHAEDATPYLRAETDLEQFSAVVIFKVKGDTKNVKGFEYPSAVPTNYKDAIAKIEEHLKAIDGLIAANDLDKVHASAEKISHVCEGLPALAPKDDVAEVTKVSKEIIALFKEIDDAADAGKKAETIKVVEKYRAKLAVLKKHA
jgi:hypothetical protein